MAEEKPDYDKIRQKIEELQAQLAQVEQVKQLKAEVAEPIKTIVTWEAPDRVFFERSRLFYVVVSLIFIIAIAIAALLQEILLIIAIIALMFLVYLSSTIKPALVKHEITNKGIKSANSIWLWKEIKGFWLSRRGNFNILLIDLVETATPNRLMLLLGTTDPQAIVKLLIRHIPYLNKQQIGEDFINVFTLGEYQPVTRYLEEQTVLPAKQPTK